jgi:hypothetical protein
MKETEPRLTGEFSLSVLLEGWGTLTLACLVLKLIWLVLPPAQAGVQCPTDRWIYSFNYFLNPRVLGLYLGIFFYYNYPDLIEVEEVDDSFIT